MIGDIVEIGVTGLAPGGDAVGRQIGGETAGRVTFVPLAAPGERVRARVVREKARVAWAELTSVEQASEVRVTPPCPLFGRCGGCQWQHVARDAQLTAKLAIVARALGLQAEQIEAVAVGPAFGYRARARVTRGDEPGVVGFHERRSWSVVDVPACPLMGGGLAAAWPALRRLAEEVPPGTELAAQESRDGSVGVSAPGRSWRIRGDQIEAVDARAAEADKQPEVELDVSEPGSPPLRIAAGAFSQVGFAANAAMVAELLSQVGEGVGTLLELYAGSGNFTRHLVGRAATVVAAEGDRRSVARGRVNVPAASWCTHGEVPSGVPHDVVVVDPPREGLDERALDLAARARDRIVYASCDPQTLGRDVRRLRDSGFQLGRVAALDVMPQTYHVETVLTLHRVR